jgi:mannose-1-phosphate guanylyltransferase
VLINVHAHAAAVRDFVKQNANVLRVRVVEETHLLGSAGTLRANRDWVAEDEMFWVFYADVLCRFNLADMLGLHRRRKAVATLGVYKVPDPGRCGIVSTDVDGVIQQFVEKPANPASNLAFAGVMIGTPELLDVIPPDTPIDIGVDVLPQLTGRMLAFPISDYVIDIGTMENYRIAQATWPGLAQSI